MRLKFEVARTLQFAVPAFYEFTDCAVQFINCTSSQIAPNIVTPTVLTANGKELKIGKETG